MPIHYKRFFGRFDRKSSSKATVFKLSIGLFLTFIWNSTAFAAPSDAIWINALGNYYTDVDGQLWIADTYFKLELQIDYFEVAILGWLLLGRDRRR